MLYRESETVELKRNAACDLKKEIIAFANSDGGTIFIGIEDDGTVIGIDETDKTALQISNSVRDAVKPDLTMFVHYETLEADGKYILRIDVQRGTQRPYYIAKKGLKPEGVYVRQGYSAVPASDSAIRRMIKDTDGDRYEEMRSLNQNLTFEYTAKEFKLRDIGFGPEQLRTLKFTNQEGIFTNLGLLMSEQCMHTVKTAVFQGTDQSIFRDRHEFTGPLLQQLNEVYEYIEKYNRIRADYQGLLRVDTKDYPDVAVREALLNVLVHRDYSFSAGSLVSIYNDRIEFLSVGGLVSGIGPDDIMMGLSVCRNQNLANLFYRLRLIEAYGTGIKKIMGAYESSSQKPVIDISGNAFKVTLPNMNTEHKKDPNAAHYYEELTDDEILILDYIKQRGTVTRADVETILNTSASTAVRILHRMVEKGSLIKTGKGKNVTYRKTDGLDL